MGGKVEELDGLRGLAAIGVVFSHVLLWMYPYLHMGSTDDVKPSAFAQYLFNSPFTFFYKGTSAVILFFIMSGFVLTYSALQKGASIEMLRASAMKRYFRLNIPVAASIFLCWVLSSLGLFLGAEFQLTQPLSEAYTAPQGALYALKDALFGSILSGSSGFNYVLWSINIEFFGSMLVFALIALFGGQRISLAIISMALCLFTISHRAVFVWSMGLFAFGIFLAVIKYQQTITNEAAANRKMPMCRMLAASAMLVFGIYLLGYHYLSASYYYPARLAGGINELIGRSIDWGFFMPILGSMLVVSCIVIDPRVLSLLKNRFFQWLGKLSFSVYLIHTFVISLVLPLVIKFFGINYISILFSLVLVISVTLLVSTLFYRYIDLYAIRKAGHFANQIIHLCRDKPSTAFTGKGSGSNPSYSD